MRFLVSVLFGIFLGFSAHAATFQATVAINDTQNALGSLGANLLATHAIVTWSVENGDPPIQSYSTSNSVGNTLPYRSLSVAVGGVYWSHAAPSNVDYVNVSDGTDPSGFDYFALTSLTPVSGPNGSTITSLLFSMFNEDETIFSGTSHPTLTELNQLNVNLFGIGVRDASGGAVRVLRFDGDIDIVEISTVPLPAGAILLITGVAGLGIVRHRKRS